MKRILSVVLFGALMVPVAWAQSEGAPKCSELSGSYPTGSGGDHDGDDHAWAQCWQELDEQPGCYVYREHYHTGESVRGTGTCQGGLIVHGMLTLMNPLI